MDAYWKVADSWAAYGLVEVPNSDFMPGCSNEEDAEWEGPTLMNSGMLTSMTPWFWSMAQEMYDCAPSTFACVSLVRRHGGGGECGEGICGWEREGRGVREYVLEATI